MKRRIWVTRLLQCRFLAGAWHCGGTGAAGNRGGGAQARVLPPASGNTSVAEEPRRSLPALKPPTKRAARIDEHQHALARDC